MKIYTRKGDGGETSLLSGRRAGKADPVIAVSGDLDELSAALGLAALAYPAVAPDVREIQRDLYALGAAISAEGLRAEFAFPDKAADLERLIDATSGALPPLRDFIYPGETEAGARLHLARAVARRAERSASACIPPPPTAVMAYLNRLSDLLFEWARQADHAGGHAPKRVADE